MLAPPITTERLSLEMLDPHVIRLLLEGEVGAAGHALGAELPAEFAGEHVGYLRRHLSLLERHPDRRGWCARLMFERAERRVVGHCGFHGPPEVVGRAEIGYTVLEPFRGRGLAKEAARALVDWAFSQEVREVYASVSPANGPSLAVVRAVGFREVGVQEDPVDGTEVVFAIDQR